MITMDGFDAYKTYVALKNHFTTKSYDYFKYNGRCKVSKKTFEKRNDRYFFHKLSKQKNIVDYLVANLVYGDDTWIGDVINNTEAERCYRQFMKVRESLSYIIKNDLDKFDAPFVENFIVNEGQHPKALRMVLEKQIHIETLIVLNEVSGFMKKWNKKIEDDIVWPMVYNKCKKLRPFLQFDKEKMKQVVVDKIKEIG